MTHSLWNCQLPLRCKKCKTTHLKEYNCEQIRCKICHNLHFHTQVVQGLCPLIYSAALKLRQTVAFTCKVCVGVGKCPRGTFTTYLIQEWEQKKQTSRDSNQSGQNCANKKIEKPVTNETCKQCNGLGQINRFIYCCEVGCLLCYFQGMIQNPVWITYKRREKSEPFYNNCQDEIQCAICLQLIGIGQKMYKMECLHKFHRLCIIKWMEQKQECPLCRRKDVYFSKKLIEQLPVEDRPRRAQRSLEQEEEEEQSSQDDSENEREGSELSELGSEAQQTQFLILPNQQ